MARDLDCAGPEVSGVLAPGDCTLLDGTSAQVWRVQIAATTSLEVQMRSSAFRPRLELRSSDCAVLQPPTSSAGDFASVWSTLERGTYFVIASGAGPPGGGAYTLDADCTTLFLRGDANRDGEVTISDALALLSLRFESGEVVVPCADAADMDDNGLLNLEDPLFLLGWIAVPSSQRPIPPFPDLGFDPCVDSFRCDDGRTTPATPSPGVSIEWKGPAEVERGQKDVAWTVLATTDQAIDGFSLAARVAARFLENLRVDLEGTVFPGELAAGFVDPSPPRFGTVLTAAADPQYLVLRAGAAFADETLRGRIDFAATRGPMTRAPILRVLADVRDDAPVHEAASVLLSSPKEDINPYTARAMIRTEISAAGGKPMLPGSEGKAVLTAFEPGEIYRRFLRADASNDGVLNIVDPIFTLGYLFIGRLRPGCLEALDADRDGVIGITDAVYTLGYLFLGGPPPSSPFPRCERLRDPPLTCLEQPDHCLSP